MKAQDTHATAWHPWLFAAYPVLFLFTANRDLLRYRDIVTPMAIALGAATLLFAAFRLLGADRVRSARSTSAVVLGITLYGHVRNVILEAQLWDRAHGGERWVFGAWLVMLSIVLWLIWRRRPPTPLWTQVLNAVSAGLILLNLGLLMVSALQARQPSTRQADTSPTAPVTTSVDRPDIYYIILDAYGRHDTLERQFGFDNHAFLDQLEQRGFMVGERSHANYAMTFLSLASSLNMRYIDFMDEDETAWHGFNEMIANNEVLRFLDQRGYTSVHFRSGKGITNHNPFADLNYRGGTFDELETLLIETSLLSPFLDRKLNQDRSAQIRYAIDRLPDVARLPEPTFAFAHILCPHPPFLFARDGQPVAQPPADPNRAYIEQLQFLNDQVIDLIDRVDARSAQPPVFIIQGDHGPSSSVDWQVKRADWLTNEALVHERMPILNAYRLPGLATEIDPEISPVNSFRLLLNHYFDGPFEPLENRSYLSSYSHPYRFVDVTGSLVEKRETLP